MRQNEVVFRKYNEKVQNQLKRELAKEKRLGYANDEAGSFKLHFICECADENCQERIVMTVNKYSKLHKNKKQFIIVPDHDVKSIEKVSSKNKAYEVVEKFIQPPQEADTLHPTPVGVSQLTWNNRSS